jgi:2-(1,2-epoxy-1,2-dihydrophenyl)acetyl-CoA isomerase
MADSWSCRGSASGSKAVWAPAEACGGGSPHLLYDVADGVATITLARPEARNAFTVPMLEALYRAAVRASEDPGVRAIALTGAGGHFSAGGDVKMFGEMAAKGGAHASALVKELTLHFHGAVATLARAPKPWICAVDGTAAGGGFSLAIAGDLTVASDRARLTYAYTNIGLAPDGSSSWSLPRLIGLQRAMRLAFTNPTLSAEEARALGLVAEVLPATDFESRWRAFARDLASRPTRALAGAKRLLRAAFGRDIEAQMEDEREAISACARSADFAEGVAAFAQKRKATFRGE